MKVFGYQKDRENLLELSEASLLCNIEELERIIKFLQNVKEKHSEMIGEEMGHWHYRDWDKDWEIGSPDIIVVKY